MDRAGLRLRQVLDRERDAVAHVGKVVEVMREQHFDVAMPCNGVAQHGLEFGLDEMDAGRPAERVGGRDDVGLFDGVAVDAEIARAGMGPDMGAQFLADTGELHAAHDFVIGGDRSRIVVDAGHALDHEDLQALAAQQSRGGGADGSVSDNRDVAVHRVGCKAQSGREQARRGATRSIHKPAA